MQNCTLRRETLLFPIDADNVWVLFRNELRHFVC
jgi:hypothetical protein